MGLSDGTTRPLMARVFSVMAVALLLAACSAPARETFDFDGAIAKSQSLVIKTTATVAVGEPSAAGPIASDRVVVRQSDQSLAVLPEVQWSERLPKLVQRRFIVSLERVGVAAALPGANAAYRLQADLRRFEIDVAQNTAVAEVAVRLTNEASGGLRAAAVFTTQVPAPDHTGPSAIRALSEAADESAHKVAGWARGRL